MFDQFNNAILALALGLAALGIAGSALAWVVLWLINLVAPLDPRLGATVKMGLLRTGLSAVALGMGSGVITIARAVAASANTPPPA